jgi:hypothetical protein
VAAVKDHRKEMLEAVRDPEAWGPAKALAVAALDAGVDLTDRDQVEKFIQDYNDGIAAYLCARRGAPHAEGASRCA